MNIDGPQIIEMQSLAAKLLIQETSNDRQIVGQCCRREAALRTQESSERADQLALGGRVDHPRRHWNATDVAQIYDQLPNGPGVATPDAATTFRQELTGMVPSEDIQRNIVFLHPKGEIRQKVILLTHRRWGIALVTEQCREPVKVGGQSTDAEGCGRRRSSVV
jgi:hypothetical protein